MRRSGQWDPSLDAYRVVDSKDGSTKFFVWKRPSLFFDAFAMSALLLFWVGVATVVYLCFFHWPEGVAGDRKAQLADALAERYRVDVSYLPENWTATQVFTVDIDQGWDDPAYDEAPVTTKACKLQPGNTAENLSLQCPNYFGTYEEVRVGGLDAAQDQQTKRLEEQTPANPPGADDSANEGSYDQYGTDPYEYYAPDPYEDYEPEEMYP